jgi:hypothetical protein
MGEIEELAMRDELALFVYQLPDGNTLIDMTNLNDDTIVAQGLGIGVKAALINLADKIK